MISLLFPDQQIFSIEDAGEEGIESQLFPGATTIKMNSCFSESFVHECMPRRNLFLCPGQTKSGIVAQFLVSNGVKAKYPFFKKKKIIIIYI